MNSLSGRISSIVTEGKVSRVGVDVGGATLSAVVLETPGTAAWLREDGPVVCLFKETEVGLARGLRGVVSFGNRIESVVESLEGGRIFTRVRLGCPGGKLSALIGTEEASSMDLHPGENLTALIHPGEIMLMVPEGGDAS